MTDRLSLGLALPVMLALVACARGGASDPLSSVSIPQIQTASAAQISAGSDGTVADIAPAGSSSEASAIAQLETAGIMTGGGTPTAGEIAYANANAAGLFRRRKFERATTFLPAGAVDGYGLCLRAPARKGSGYDYVLVLQARRGTGEAVSQVDDDTLVMRRTADVAPCRTGSLAWVAVR
ncbi:hypothetical protein [Jiella avicenniae]|uniref:Lipoprotein n=1 Tax=Jiella avicenniae TaxID=2907202 RepID=A0A9X1P016_9HYPH|nr:hypothetical protein [Jiella avicenniae]MCE7026856.1 hypothetical protein [Jiella avicenniae]